jgi:citrate synthase
MFSKYGELRYRGIDINELVNGFVSEERLGFEEVSYLILVKPAKTPLPSRSRNPLFTLCFLYKEASK